MLLEKMLEEASRRKLRFPSRKGLITLEDVWDLSLTSRTGISLDDTAKELHRQVNESKEVSFVVVATKASSDITIAFELVKHVISVRVSENASKQQKLANKEHNDKIRAIIGQKKDAALADMSVEDLEKAIKS